MRCRPRTRLIECFEHTGALACPLVPEQLDVLTHDRLKAATCAEKGECENNPSYMVGAGSAYGHCGVSCGTCTPCAPGDSPCLIANRERLGYLGDLESELEQLFPSD